MKKFSVYGIVTGSKSLGEYEAETKEEAIEKAFESENCYVSLCHYCANEVDSAEILSIQAVEI